MTFEQLLTWSEHTTTILWALWSILLIIILLLLVAILFKVKGMVKDAKKKYEVVNSALVAPFRAVSRFFEEDEE